MTPETKLKNQILRRLTAMRAEGEQIWWMKLHGGPMQRAGVPDLLVLYCGVAFFFELKAPDGEATKLQLHTMQQIKDAGGTVSVVRSAQEAMEIIFSF